MSELKHREPAQPSLLDRLTSDASVAADASGRSTPSREQISAKRLREIVKRDLAWLLNTGNLAEVQDLNAYPHVNGSVVNYGIPDITGAYVSNADLPKLERRLEQAIALFEPRIMRSSLEVKANRMASKAGNQLCFEIQCEMWSHPTFEQLALRLEMDMDTGTVAYALAGED